MSTKRNLERIAGRLKASAAHILRNRGEHCLPGALPHAGGRLLLWPLLGPDGRGVPTAPKLSRNTSSGFERNNWDGTDTGPITRFLRASGLSVRVYKEKQARIATLIDALEGGIPVIVSIRPPHYLVVSLATTPSFSTSMTRFSTLRVSGRLTRQEFRRMWTREALLVTERPLTSRRFTSLMTFVSQNSQVILRSRTLLPWSCCVSVYG